MKRLLFLIFAVLANTLLANRAFGESPTTIMGFLISDDDDRAVGWYKFPATDASNLQLIKETKFVSAGVYADGTYYAQTYTPGPVVEAWNSFNIETGEFNKIADCGTEIPLYADMTYDYSKKQVLGIYHPDGISTTLCAIDPATGKPQTIAELEGNWLVTLAATYDGLLYAVSNDGNLYRIDSGKAVLVGKTGIIPDYMQSMAFDYKTETLYWAASTSWEGCLYKIDITTGTATYISNIGNNGEITGLYIPSQLALPEAPAAVTDLMVNNDNHDSSVSLSMTLPGKTVNGENLASITSVTMEVDGSPLKTWQQGLTPGIEFQGEAEVTEGYHVIKVYASNEAGQGLPALCRTFIGEDTPHEPENITVQSDGLDATIEWDAVTKGANSGWIDANAVTYTVVRQPGNIEIAKSIKQTQCADKVEKMGAYHYEVVASTGKGDSEKGVSDVAVIGDELDVPYSFDFENEDELKMWKITDGNNDGATWERSTTYDGKRTMLMRGTYNRVIDDWLISPPLKLEAGKSYKLVYDHGVMNMYYPASYQITIGKGNSVTDQTTIVKQITTEELYLNKTIVYLPEITETGTYNIGFHANWQPSVATLYISNFNIEENQAAWLTATVTDGENPIEGATVKFNDATYTTDDNGKFEIIEIEPGKHTLGITKFGFEPVSQELDFASLEHKTLTIPMQAIPTATVSGKVLTEDGKGLENASVNVHGYSSYTAVTGKDGSYKVEGVYCKGGYSVDAHALNYESASQTIDNMASDTEMTNFVLKQKLIAPANVTTEATREKSEIQWDAPEDKPAEYRYDDGTDDYVFSMEMSDVSEYTVEGVVVDSPAVFTSMSWHVNNSVNTSAPVSVIVFDLDENGKPTNKVLYEEDGLESENWEWHECVFKYPIIAPRGAMFALKGDARLCMDAGGQNPQYPLLKDKMLYSKDYRTGVFNTLDALIYQGNFTLRAKGLPYGAPRKQAQAATTAPNATYDVWRLADGEESNEESWMKLTESPISSTKYTDTDWNNVAKGKYRYAVKAVYPDGYSSYPAISEMVPRLLTSQVTINFTTNAPGENAAGAKAVLTSSDSNHSYTAEVDADNRIILPVVWEGTYTLTVTKKGFATLEKEISISGNADFSGEFELKEATAAPSNLLIEETDNPKSRLLRWNVVNGIFDDFESHEDFKINSTGDAGWSYIDGDGSQSYSSPNYEFPNRNEPMAFIVLNPSNTEPSMVDADYLNAHSGERILVGFTNNDKSANDDYIISPELTMPTDFVISFYARCYWSKYVETIRVGYSTTGKDADDFQWIGDNITVDNDTWKQFIVNVPKEAKYVAINYISQDKYLVAIDDIFIGAADKIPGTTATSTKSRVAGSPTSYEVYLDGEKLATTTATEYLLENLSDGKHTAGVKSVYASGVTDISTIDFSVNYSGVDGIGSTNTSIYATDGYIIVENAPIGSIITVYGADGMELVRCKADRSTIRIPQSAGIYMVRTEAGISKVLVR